MARATVQPAVEPYLIPGEIPQTTDPEDARQWVTIYRELVAFAERSLNRLRSEVRPGTLDSGLNDADQRSMEMHVRRLRSRLDYWEQRFWELAGLDLDVRRRWLSHGGQRLKLTRRETELLAFLAERPGQFYSAGQLVTQAWEAPELSEEQLRTYIVRLRRHLATARVPARLVSEPRRGYGLVFSA
jgi:DNA-binding response OmpR family regulator